jgi:hypothetical protein
MTMVKKNDLWNKMVKLENVVNQPRTTDAQKQLVIDMLVKHGRNVSMFDIIKAEKISANNALLDLLDLIHPHWFDIDTLKNSKKNLLAVKDATGKKEYDVAVAHLLAKLGTPVSLFHSFYSWSDIGFSIANKGNPVVAITGAKQDEWGQFAGSDHDSDIITGVSGVATFANGKQRILRFEGTFTSIMRDLTDPNL